MTDAQKETKVSRKRIGEVCSGKKKRGGDYLWRYHCENDEREKFDIEEDGYFWKAIKNFPNYLISRNGKVYSKIRKIIRKTKVNSCGYECLELTNGTGNVGLLIHRLVSEAYILNPNNKEFVNHKDGNKLNNDINNLEWCNCQENVKHAVNNGLLKNSKKVKQLSMDGKFIAEYPSMAEAQRQTGCNPMCIRKCCLGIFYHSGGWKWEYY